MENENSVEAHDERERIATGRHERFIVHSMAKFLARAAEKLNTGDVDER